jgi:hypothetical protein
VKALFVAGIGLFAPGLPDWTASVPVLSGAAPWENAGTVLPMPVILPKNERRRSSPAIRLALEVAHQAVSAAGVPPADLPVFFGSSSGDGDVVNALLETLTEAEARVSPTLFHNSVHNAPAGYWCIAVGSHQPSLSIGAFDVTVPATLLAAAVQACDRPALLCLYDALLPEPLHTARPVAMPFGAALVLSPTPTPANLGRLQIELGTPDLPSSLPQTPGLTALFDGNPCARLLPLLEVLARRQSRRVVIPWEDAPPISIIVSPC